MRTIIAGSRACRSLTLVTTAIESSPFKPTVVLSGTALGVDTLGEFWAAQHNIPVERYPADWITNGRQAGFLRNIKMAEKAEALIAIWNGRSPGTKHMLHIAGKYKLEIYVYFTNKL